MKCVDLHIQQIISTCRPCPCLQSTVETKHYVSQTMCTVGKWSSRTLTYKWLGNTKKRLHGPETRMVFFLLIIFVECWQFVHLWTLIVEKDADKYSESFHWRRQVNWIRNVIVIGNSSYCIIAHDWNTLYLGVLDDAATEVKDRSNPSFPSFLHTTNFSMCVEILWKYKV